MKPLEPERLLFEYAVVRYVPRVERDEFFNVGLLMMCKSKRWIRFEWSIDEARFASFKPLHTREELENVLKRVGDVANGVDMHELGPMAVEERFRWLSSAKSSCLSTSHPHPGLSSDLDVTFDRLFRDMVVL